MELDNRLGTFKENLKDEMIQELGDLKREMNERMYCLECEKEDVNDDTV